MRNQALAFACLSNPMTAMRDIDLPSGNPLTYLKQLIWEAIPNRNIAAPAPDRFYAYAYKHLVTQVKLAAQEGEFAPLMDPHVFHQRATTRYTQRLLVQANVHV